MSLVQEPIIGVINRRFVFCFYDAFAAGRGGDKAAAEFFRKHGGRGYGAIFTPEGKCLSSFGYNMPEVYRSLVRSREQSREHWWLTDAEQAIFDLAAKEPTDLKAQLAAAQLHAELLDATATVKLLNTFVEASDSPEEKRIARYWSAHYALTDSDLRYHSSGRSRVSGEERRNLHGQRAALRVKLTKLEGLPRHLEDDRAMDLLSLDVGQRQGAGFYTGWQFDKDVNKEAVIDRLKELISKNPASNRIGQMHFLLGLANANSGDMKKANEAWKAHYEKYPADRFSMLSRFHHTSYQFSPHGGGRGGIVVGGRSRRISSEEVERILKSLNPNSDAKE